MRSILIPVLVGIVVLVVGGAVLLRSGPDGDDASAPQETTASPAMAAPAAPVTGSDRELAISAGQKFLYTYVSDEGRVIRRDQGGDTVSEGQAYGMLIAAAVDNRERFDLIWDWTRENIQRDDALLAFRWRDGKVVDAQPASDADLDAARALLLAAERWDEDAYRTAALSIAQTMLLRETVDVGGLKYLVAGPWARERPAVVNVSYFSPRAFQALQVASGGDRRWSEIQRTSLETVDGLMARSPALPPDWARLSDGEVVPGPRPGGDDGDIRYGYEAMRTLPRYAEMCSTSGPDPNASTAPIGRRIVARAWPFLSEQGTDRLLAEYTPAGEPIGGGTHPLAAVAAAAAAASAGDVDARDRLLDRAQELQNRGLNYYGGAWVALGRIMLTTDLLGSCDDPAGLARP